MGRSVKPTSQVIDGNFPYSGEFIVMVIADSKSDGKIVGTADTGVMLPNHPYMPLSFPLTSHPTGIVRINFQKVTDAKQ